MCYFVAVFFRKNLVRELLIRLSAAIRDKKSAENKFDFNFFQLILR
jgi:hypothetical protein